MGYCSRGSEIDVQDCEVSKIYQELLRLNEYYIEW